VIFPLVLALFGVLGAVFGSFLNVVIYRVPRSESVVKPASHCPHCGSAIRARDNIPILSWILLGRRCRDCREPISARYPLVEGATAAALIGVAALFLPGLLAAQSVPEAISASASLVGFSYLAVISIALCIIDIESHRLPDVIVLPGYAVAAAMLAIGTIASGDTGRLTVSLIAGVGLFILYFVPWFIVPAGMGFGDVKLAGVLGLFLGWLGWGQFAVGAFAPFLLGGVFSVVLLLLRRAGRKSRIPFGPWMLLGAWIGIVVGDEIFSGYLALFGLNP
jgi:leader peptidase (prepilin peptidase) / N-methyltransferase